MKKAVKLRELLNQEGMLVVPGVTTALFARVAQERGFQVLFVTGAGLANMNFGLPDYGLITMTENLELVKRINDNTTLPLIVDIDDGYGNPMNVYRTLKEYSRLDLGAVILEDQKAPKRCGHFEDHAVISKEDMASKIKAAREGSVDPDLVLFARTDAISVNGIDDAIDRAHAYLEAGADAIFIEAPRTLEQMKRIPREVPAPTLINLVEGGKTPMLTNKELEAMGFKVALYANAPLKASIKGMQNLLDYLKENGTTEGSQGQLMIPSSERHQLTDKQFYMDLQKRYRSERD